MKTIENEDGSITTISSFAEIFLDNDVINEMNEDQKNAASKEIIDLISGSLMYKACPRLNVSLND